MNNIPFDQIISNKLPSSYPKYAIENMNLVSIDKERSIPIGTFSYAATLYPSDIDVFESVKYGHSENEVVDFFAKSIQKIVYEISRRKYYYILEVKVGIDYRYDFKIQDLEAMTRINKLYSNHLLSDEDIIILNDDPEVANDLLRKHSVLRWSVRDIIIGYKPLPGGVVMSLHDAIRAKSQINIEVIGLINGKFTDLSNFFVLIYTDKNGREHVVNASQELISDFPTFFTKQLRANIKKLYYSPIFHDYYKLIKRYWSYGRFTKDQQLIEKILPIVNSSLAIVGQKKSEITTLVKLVEHTRLRDVPMDSFKNQVSNIKLSLAGVLGLDNETKQYIDEQIDTIVNQDLSPDKIINILDGVKEILKEYSSEKAFQYLQSVGLAPPPDKYIN